MQGAREELDLLLTDIDDLGTRHTLIRNYARRTPPSPELLAQVLSNLDTYNLLVVTCQPVAMHYVVYDLNLLRLIPCA